jgi:DNA-binding MltR family transcriptional regulator
MDKPKNLSKKDVGAVTSKTIENMKKDPYIKDLLESILMYKESDRGLVIVVTSFIDDLMADVISSRMVNPKTAKENKKDELFDLNGPLYNLGPKVELAYRMGIINIDLKNNINKISKLRNDHFAHNRKKIVLGIRPVSDKVKSMYDSKPMSVLEKALGSSEPKSAREKFTHFAYGVIIELISLRNRSMHID